MGLDALAHGLHDLEVDAQKVVAAHARLAGDAGGDDADVGTRDVGVGVRAGQPASNLSEGRIRRCRAPCPGGALGDVEEHDVAELLDRGEVGERSADLSRADEGDLRSGHGM
jgi:hypothetical protein